MFIAHSSAPPDQLLYRDTIGVYTKGTAISNNMPNSAGGVVETYTIDPALPAGLSFNTASGVISGTPSVLSTTATTYTVTATNSGGEDTVDIVITVNDGACFPQSFACLSRCQNSYH